MRLLLVEDDRLLADGLASQLEKAGFSVDSTFTAKEALMLAEQEDYRAVVLDLGLPDGNGLDVLRKWRMNRASFPVLILTARGDWQDKVNGLKAGADDYLAKPFQTEELIARLNAIIRRSEGRVHSLVKAGNLELDENRQSLKLADGTEHSLTGTEFRLLRCLMSRPGHVFSKEQLMEQLYNLNDNPSENVIEAYIRRLRKLGTLRVSGADIPEAPSDILAYRKSFRVNDQPIVVIVSEDLGALSRSQAELHAWTAVVSLLLILLLVGALWLGINLSMRPVVSLKAALRRLQDGEISRIDVKAPEEFQPLVMQLNQLLDSLDQRLERSRDALANLSHSVKTPIAAVRQILEDTDRPLANDLRQQMAGRLDDIDRQLEAEMRRSRFAGPQVGKSAYPLKQARDLLWMLGRLYPAKSFEMSTVLTEERRWPIEEHDLNEVLGNLLDNAGKWSTRFVELGLYEDRQEFTITVEDDGPGIPPDALDTLGTRGLRLDEQTPGHGLGLAIVREITERYGGTLNFCSGSIGGLKATDEIRELIGLAEQPEADCSDVDTLLARHLTHVRERLRELASLEETLVRLQTACTDGRKVRECGILGELNSELGALEPEDRHNHVPGTHGPGQK
eukprot:g4877.t1